jgi:hypothetical protein
MALLFLFSAKGFQSPSPYVEIRSLAIQIERLDPDVAVAYVVTFTLDFEAAGSLDEALSAPDR